MGIDSVDGFFIEQNISFPTGYGDLSVGYKSSSGVKTLVIMKSEKYRYFKLDRPFEIIIPSSYYTSVQYTKDKILIVEILGKSK